MIIAVTIILVWIGAALIPLLILWYRIIRHLYQHHYKEWEELGSPSIWGKTWDGFAPPWDIQRQNDFLRRGAYSQLNDPVLQRLCEVYIRFRRVVVAFTVAGVLLTFAGLFWTDRSEIGERQARLNQLRMVAFQEFKDHLSHEEVRFPFSQFLANPENYLIATEEDGDSLELRVEFVPKKFHGQTIKGAGAFFRVDERSGRVVEREFYK